MARQYLRDKSGHTIGYVDDRPNEQVIFDASGRRKGHYDKKSNKTYDAAGHTLGEGNLLAALISERI